MKCLEKDRTRRYETANGLAADIERHLNNEPVVARPPSSAYRFQKFVRRNKVMVTAGSVIAAVLVLGVLASTWEAFRATKEATRATKAERDQIRLRGEAQAQEYTARLWAYVSDMNAAGLSLAEGDSQRARELLERHKPKPGANEDLRGFEWRYLWGLSRPDELFVLTNSVTSARYSPDGRMLAIADDSTGEVKLWDVRSRQVLRSFKPYESTCWSVAFSPNGKMLATCARFEPDFKLWDVTTGEQIGTLTNRSQEAGSVAFSPDGKRVATVATSAYQNAPAEVKIWDLASQKELMSLPGLTSWVTRADFSPDGETIAAGDGKGLLRLWDLATGTVRVLSGHSGMVFYVRFAPNGKLLATGDENGTIILWDWTAGSVVRVLTGHQGPIYGLAVSRDGHWLASASRDHTARLWDMETGEELARFLGHSGRLWSIDFSPDGQSVATAADDKTTRVWKAAPKRESEILTRTSSGNHIGYSPDGRFLFVDETLRDVATKTISHRLAGRDITYSPDGKILALIRETNVVIYETATMRVMGTIPGKAPLTGGTAISPNGKLLALRSEGRPVIMDLEKMREIATLETDSKGPDSWKVTDHLVFTRDSKILIAADSPDGAIQLWNVPGGRPAGWLRGHQGRVGALALSPDGLMLASASEMTIRLWNLASLTAAEDPVLNGNNGAIYALAFSPDGKTLAAGSFDGPIKLWNIPGRQEIGSLKVHLSRILDLAFSPDGQTLASSSYDHTVRLWRAPRLAETDASTGRLAAQEGRR
jgi:WD40 repeat protein